MWHDSEMIRCLLHATAAVLLATGLTGPGSVASAASAASAAPDPSRDAKGLRAEIQVALCGPPERIVQALDLQPKGPPIEVWLFDDAGLTLFARGLRLRLRVAPQGSADLTLKVGDQDCGRVAPGALPPAEGKCEIDVYGTSTAGAVSITRSVDAASTTDLVAGRVPVARALSAAQARYLREAVGIWPLPPDVRALGPMRVRAYRAAHAPYDVDLTSVANRAQFAEISRKVPLAQASAAMQDLLAHLSRAGVEVCTDQSSPVDDKFRALRH